MNIAFVGGGISLATIGYSYYTKAKKMPKTNDVEIKEYKKIKDTGTSFLFTGFTFFIIGVSKVF